MPTTILVSGSRHFDNAQYLKSIINEYNFGSSEVHLVHGDCKGLERTFASIVPKHWIIHTEPAEWSRGKIAGPERNQRMIDKYRPNIVLLFPAPDSKGTLDMKRRVQEYARKNPCIIMIYPIG